MHLSADARGGKKGGREGGRERGVERLTFSETSLRMGGALEEDVAARKKQFLSDRKIKRKRGKAPACMFCNDY